MSHTSRVTSPQLAAGVSRASSGRHGRRRVDIAVAIRSHRRRGPECNSLPASRHNSASASENTGQRNSASVHQHISLSCIQSQRVSSTCSVPQRTGALCNAPHHRALRVSASCNSAARQLRVSVSRIARPRRASCVSVALQRRASASRFSVTLQRRAIASRSSVMHQCRASVSRFSVAFQRRVSASRFSVASQRHVSASRFSVAFQSRVSASLDLHRALHAGIARRPCASIIAHRASRIAHRASRITHRASRIAHRESRIASQTSHRASRIASLAPRIAHRASRISASTRRTPAQCIGTVPCRACAVLLASCIPAGAATTTGASAKQRERCDAASATAPAPSSQQQQRITAPAIIIAGVCGESGRGCRTLRFGGSSFSSCDLGHGSESTDCIASSQLRRRQSYRIAAIATTHDPCNATCTAARDRCAQPLGSGQERASARLRKLAQANNRRPHCIRRATARDQPSAAPQCSREPNACVTPAHVAFQALHGDSQVRG